MLTTDPRESPVPAEKPTLFRLVGDVAGAGLDLVHNTAQLAASEARVVVRRVVVRASVVLSLMIVASTGLLLVLGGVAFLLYEEAGWTRWAAFGSVGAVTLATAGFFAVRAVKRLGDSDLAFPHTLGEFKKDIETLKGNRLP